MVTSCPPHGHFLSPLSHFLFHFRGGWDSPRPRPRQAPPLRDRMYPAPAPSRARTTTETTGATMDATGPAGAGPAGGAGPVSDRQAAPPTPCHC